MYMYTGVRVLVICSMFAVTFAAAILPVAVLKSRRLTTRKFSQAKRTLRACTCFAAGVFLGTSMLELLPNTTAQFANVLAGVTSSIWTTYPIAEFVIVLGFFMVLILEQTALFVSERKRSNDKLRTWGSTEMLQIAENDFELSQERHESVDRPELMDDDKSATANEQEHNIGNVLLFTVLSLHSVFEGLALGLQHDLASLWTIFAALIFHKAIIGFSLSMKMLKSKLSTCRVMATVVIFSLMSPIGISIATLSSSHAVSFSSSVAECIVLGLSTGTFLFVTFVEILPHELHGSEHRLVKVAGLCLGYFVIAAIRVTPSIATANAPSPNNTAVNT